MSGMEPLAALGLACNIMQLLSFGGEAISLCRKVYKTGEIDPSLKDYSSQTAKICESLSDNLTQRQLDLGPDASSLQQRAIICKAAADKLNHELELLTPTKGASGWRRGLTAPIKAMRRKRHLSELEKDLNNLKSGLDTQLLVRIFDLVDPAKSKTEILETSRELLATTLRHVYSGQQGLSQQMLKTLEEAQSRFTSEYLRNHQVIEQHLAVTTRDLQDERTRIQQENNENERRRDWQHLVQSLHCEVRTDRLNRIGQEYSGTCCWIFEPPTKDGIVGYHEPHQVYPQTVPETWPCFTTWLQSEGPPIYWICGKPGSGKSTLMKFIASDESPTRDSLKQWRPNVRILSHYFWLAGSPMQNNIKGLLCSLVYQVLSQDMSSALTLLESKPGIAHKSSITDWDPTELRRILISLTRQPGKAFCIFIDGLDELSPEESPRDLIDMIGDIQSPQVKFCLASRPEPAMKLYLGHYPTLPMHAFIRDDIRNYAHGILSRAMSHRHDAFGVDRLVDQLVSKADGVFLWVVLVARSLERGIERGDSPQVLEERLRQMPKSLSELYTSMWQRCEDDPETYQKGFSQFMNLITLVISVRCLSHGCVSVFELMAATNTSFLDKYLNQDDHVPKEELGLLCRETRNSIEAWSAGLLMVTITQKSDWDIPLGPMENDGDTGPYCDLAFYTNLTVEYIHRTAHDFLLHEMEGQALWKRSDISRKDLQVRLVKASLMRRQLWRFAYPEPRHVDDFFGSITDSGEAAYVSQNALPDIEKAFFRGCLEESSQRKLGKHVGLEIRFLEEAFDYGFCDYVSTRIQEMQQCGQLKAQDYASLLHSYCSRRPKNSPKQAVLVARERLIQSLLSSGLPSFEKMRFSTDFNLSRSLLLTYLVSNLQCHGDPIPVEEAIKTLALLWQQAPSVQNVYVQLTVGFSELRFYQPTSSTFHIRDSRRTLSHDQALVVMRVNVPYLVMAISSLVHPSLCIPGILTKNEGPSAQAILIRVMKEPWYSPDYYKIRSEEASRKITECITPLLHCKHGSDLQRTGKVEMTEWRRLEKVLQQITSKPKWLNGRVDKSGSTKTRSEWVEAVVDEFLNDKVTKLSPPWW
ncbi:hypothetical protein CDV31_007031 [Fusarium ambrosium]|uniref:Nephrocystin 3-like N-terminal domain-containing protein n=1 Tax=Fusarium ambrosium TaxID=131363 RepID=A0A428U9B2_9HYPO|nr:hypothetical protein CDV31_007031 [Fusarium ambrosium]